MINLKRNNLDVHQKDFSKGRSCKVPPQEFVGQDTTQHKLHFVIMIVNYKIFKA